MTLRDWLRKLLGLDQPPPKPLPEKETDIAYGSDPLQKLDVYRPAGMVEGDKAPAILMVHGGGWDNTKGDKANSGVIDAKVAHYVPKGYIVLSINYPLYPQTDPLGEAQSVAAALAFAQAKVPGCDPERFTLMGHSAGGHLVALCVASGMVKGVAGTVCLDPGALDLQSAITLGAKAGSGLYAPFGTDPSKWPAMDPLACLSGLTPPWLLAYSTQRGPADAKQAKAFAARVQQFGGVATVQGFDLSHGEMDSQVGLPGPLTDAIDKFLA
jgi:acetyl esterase/lipase